VGLCLLGLALTDLVRHPPAPAWMALPALAVLTGSFTFKIPGTVVRLTVAEPIIFTATLLYGPAAGTVAAAIDAVAMSLRMGRHLRTAHRFAFNVALLSIAIWPASTAFFYLTGVDPHNPQYASLEEFLGPLYLFAAGVFISNSALLAIALAIERGVSPIQIWRQQFSWVATSYFASASVAALLVVYGPTIDVALVAVLAPLLVVSYLVFRTTVGRLDDANRHLAEVNALYLSTIETLAMAIDAKDQVTHGHIRRVQRFAVGLARRLGVEEERQLRAVEAAALLHDMGKLAIPEFILNKPGRLTPGEFDVMKTHAAVGADILSAIKFPYPVVPIVRHHHENWDGTGYPDGLRGAAIPVGARILSVVDCYDALTSDRPYRPAMTDEQALEILIQRRGTMYDPLVVDTFVAEHVTLKSAVEREVTIPVTIAPRPDIALSPIPTPDPAPTGQEELRASLKVLAAIAPGGTTRIETACRDFVSTLKGLVSFDTAAVFIIEDSLLILSCVYAEGPLSAQLMNVSIPMAEQLTGWVAANRTPVWNSNAALDLAVAGASSAVLASSIPLSDIGVLTFYSSAGREVTLSQRRAIESLLPAIGSSLAAVVTNRAQVIDCTAEPTRLAALTVLDSLLSHSPTGQRPSFDSALLLLSISPVRDDFSRPTRAPATPDLGLLVKALTQQNTHRYFLLLSDTQMLVYSHAHGDRAALTASVDTARSATALQATTIATSWIESPQALQETVRRIYSTRDSASPASHERKVH
jgi:putative nucleotidyltransferase with HDIG domain